MGKRLDDKREQAEGTLEEAKGRGKQAWGDATGDDQTHSEGQVDEAKGKAKQAWSDAKEKASDLKDKVSE